jgi:hypothetical protein
MISKPVVLSSVLSCLMTLLAVFAVLSTTGAVRAGGIASPPQAEGASAPHPRAGLSPAAAVTEQWFHISGWAFSGYFPETEVTELWNGCVYSDSSAPLYATYAYALTLPPGSTIESLRVYYYDTSEQDGRLELRQLNDGSDYLTLASVPTFNASGYGVQTVTNINHPVDYYTHSYALLFEGYQEDRACSCAASACATRFLALRRRASEHCPLAGAWGHEPGDSGRTDSLLRAA